MVMNKKKKLKIYAGCLFAVLLIGLMTFLLWGENVEILKEIFKEDVTKEEVRASLSEFGWRGYITFGILSMLQVVFAFLPAEPVQVVCGVSFGFWIGCVICTVGVIFGNTIIYVLYKIYGDKLADFFQENTELDFDRARRSPKIILIIFILYFLPAIPYGMICLFASSLDMKYPKYIIITTLGAIPSVMIGVGLGHMAIATSWLISILVFAVLVVLLVLLVKYRSKVFAKVNEYIKSKEHGRAVLKEKSRLYWEMFAITVGGFFSAQLKVKLKSNVKKLQRPSIVLCSHGSFIDFVYAGLLLKKEKPHFVMARLYSYHKHLNKLIRSLGCVPKSMFTADLENAKACMRILSNEGILAMMPEARLSTSGRYEGIHETTYRFIQKAGVPIYAIRLQGDYLANPKWGNGVRKGAKVTAELNLLFSAEEAAALPFEELKTRDDEALYYDEFKWLETQPQLKYKSKKLAEGLENILCICPHCGAKYSMRTKDRTVVCEACGAVATMDDRYAFIGQTPFENFAIWYDWQTAQFAEEISKNPAFKLESKVELRHSSIDGKSLTRHAGEGVCTLDRNGLTYKGEEDGKQIEKVFPMSQIYRLLFGAGENFEIYEGKEIWYFAPEEKRSCVAWYIVSGLLKDGTEKI